MSVKDKATIQGWVDWQAKQGKNSAQEARNRGTLVHELNAKYVREGSVLYVNDEIDSFFIPMLDHLDGFHREGLIWVEEPIDYDLYSVYLIQYEDGGKGGCLYSSRLGYAGCPDIVGSYTAKKKDEEGNEKVIFSQELTLADEKTSRDKYSRVRPIYPNKKLFGDNQQAYKDARRDHSKASKGYKKFWRTCVQLAAYNLLVKECLGIEPTQQMILIGVPGQAQRFILREDEKRAAEIEWLERLDRFKAIAS